MPNHISQYKKQTEFLYVMRKNIIILFIGIISLGITSCNTNQVVRKNPVIHKFSEKTVNKNKVMRIFAKEATESLSKRAAKKAIEFTLNKAAKNNVSSYVNDIKDRLINGQKLKTNETVIQKAAYDAALNYLQSGFSSDAVIRAKKIAFEAGFEKNQKLEEKVIDVAATFLSLTAAYKAIDDYNRLPKSKKLNDLLDKNLLNKASEEAVTYQTAKYLESVQERFLFHKVYPNEKEIWKEASKKTRDHLKSTNCKTSTIKVEKIALKSALEKNQKLEKPVDDRIVDLLALIAAYQAIESLPPMDKLLVEFGFF